MCHDVISNYIIYFLNGFTVDVMSFVCHRENKWRIEECWKNDNFCLNRFQYSMLECTEKIEKLNICKNTSRIGSNRFLAQVIFHRIIIDLHQKLHLLTSLLLTSCCLRNSVVCSYYFHHDYWLRSGFKFCCFPDIDRTRFCNRNSKFFQIIFTIPNWCRCLLLIATDEHLFNPYTEQ